MLPLNRLPICRTDTFLDSTKCSASLDSLQLPRIANQHYLGTGAFRLFQQRRCLPAPAHTSFIHHQDIFAGQRVFRLMCLSAVIGPLARIHFHACDGGALNSGAPFELLCGFATETHTPNTIALRFPRLTSSAERKAL